MKPILAITMGDPAGIGPEIIVRALNHCETYEQCRPIVTGDAAIMRQAVQLLGYNLHVNAVNNVADARFQYGTIDVYDLQCVDLSTFEFGKVQPQCGNAAFQYIKKAIELTALLRHRSTRKRSTSQAITMTVIQKSMPPSPIPRSTP